MIRAANAAPGLGFFLLCAAAAATVLEATLPLALGLSSGVAFTLNLGIRALVASAVAVTLHRFVILSEPNTVASLMLRWRIVLDFAFVLFGLQFLIMLPTLLADSIWGGPEAMPGGVPTVCIAIAIVGFVVLLRYLLVFPAIAIDAGDRSLQAAAVGAGRVVLPIVCASIIAMLVISLVGGLVGAPLLLLGLPQSSPALKIFALVAELAMSAATVAVVSRAYLWRDGRWPVA